MAPPVVLRAASATPVMFLVISELPRAASARLRLISLVVALCSSTALAIVFWMSLICTITLLIWPMASTEPLVSVWMASIFRLISSVALAVSLASSFTSLATTAKPLPASPARAASMVAFSASRLVCCAIEVMTLITCPISALLWPSLLMVSLVASADFTAAVATRVASAVFLAISLMLAPISSAPVATVWTLLATCSEAAETTLAWVAVWSALALICWLTRLSSSAADTSAVALPPIC